MTRKKEIIFAIVTLVIIVGAVEIVFRYFFIYRSEIRVLERRTLEAYSGKPWADQYFSDMLTCAKQKVVSRKERGGTFTRYLMHDLTDICVTRHINYEGKTNTRKTWNVDIASLSQNKTYSVAFFGGSTMVGLGTIDDLTIPSHFSRLANAQANGDGVYYLVKNYGVSSYTFTQSLIKLIFLLREGEKFDYVVFYDGTNDIDNAYDTGEAGALVGEKTLRNKLEGSFSDDIKEFVKNQINSCGICKAIIMVSRNTPILREYITPYLLRVRRVVTFQEGLKKDEGEIESLARDIADYYIKSQGLLDAISRAYGFKYAKFWQPALIYGGDPVGGETRLFASDNRLTDEKLKTLYRLTREHVRSADIENFYDISDALDGRESAYYIDAVHMSGEGNGDVAQRIFELIGDELPG